MSLPTQYRLYGRRVFSYATTTLSALVQYMITGLSTVMRKGHMSPHTVKTNYYARPVLNIITGRLDYCYGMSNALIVVQCNGYAGAKLNNHISTRAVPADGINTNCWWFNQRIYRWRSGYAAYIFSGLTHILLS